MRDQFVFTVAPYLAAASLVLMSLVRYALQHRRPAAGPAEPAGDEAGGGVAIWRLAIAIVLLGHLLGLVFPSRILLWNRQPLRLFLLEGTGVLTSGIALIGLIAAFVQRLRAPGHRGEPSAFDLIAGTLITIEVVSGIGTAMLYRWASSWSAVTLAPYLLSVLRLEPSAVLVADMPHLVRLHVFCAFAILAVAPFTETARLVVVAVHTRVERTAARVRLACAPAWAAIGMRHTKPVRFVQDIFLSSEEREN
jgi:nitrate reductase gamma subunit